MSYFGTHIGQRPVLGTEDREKGTRNGDQRPRSCFAAQTGPRPPTTGSPNPQSLIPNTLIPNTQSPVADCPLCRGPLVKQDGLYHCQGRCRARWVEASLGHLIDLAALPLGACTCCEPRQALVQSDRGAVCPASGRAFLLLPDGTTLLADAAPHGVCQCCVPPLPLVEQDGHLVCQARPHNRYQRIGDQLALIPAPKTTAPPTETLQAIDAALRRNSARVTVYGLFDVE